MTASANHSESPVQEGEVVAGKYRIEKIIGRGGMGVVVAAHHLQLDERVAIKFMGSEASALPEFVERFAREARASAKIKSEHVVRVFDVDTLSSGVPYIVMEHLEGVSLSGHARAKGRLDVTEAVDYVIQATEALAAAHAVGVVHRDLKPSNLFMTHRLDGSVCIKVLDFGISKFVGVGSESESELTGSLSVVGSPSYMAPEQMASARTVDARADIWSFGALLFKLLTGETPFVGAGLPQICTSILHGAPKPLRELAPHVPPELEAVVLRCLEKDRDARFQTAAELAVALAPFASEGAQLHVARVRRMAGMPAPPQRSFASLPELGADPTAGPGQTISVHSTASAAPGRRGWWALGGLAACAIAAVVVLSLRTPVAEHGAPAAELSAPTAAVPAVSAAIPATEGTAPPASASAGHPAESAVPPTASAVPSALPPEQRAASAGKRSKTSRPAPAALSPKPKPTASPAPKTGSKGLDLFSDPK